MKERCSEKLQPMEDLCEIKDIPKKTVACEGHMLRQGNSKKGNRNKLLYTDYGITKGPGRDWVSCVMKRKGIKLSRQKRSAGLKHSLV